MILYIENNNINRNYKIYIMWKQDKCNVDQRKDHESNSNSC